MTVRLLDAGGPVTGSLGSGSDGRSASCIEQPPASPTGAAARPLAGGCSSSLAAVISRAHRAWQKTQPQYAFDLEV